MYCYVTVEIFDEEKKQWVKREKMAAVVKSGCLYIANMRDVSNVATERIKKTDEFQKADKNARYEMAKKSLKQIVESCEISKDVPGEFYSQSTLWRIKFTGNDKTE